ncbi:MAG: alpha-isopropylmalate synthase regulatory domain-containing protein, partial [Endomicrobiales bacterium]
KELADKKKVVYDDDIVALAEEGTKQMPATFLLEYLNTSSGTGVIPTATVRVVVKKDIMQEAACGDGPVDAAYKAIDKITGIKVKLADYNLRAISGGKDAQGEVNVRVEYNGMTFTGRATSTDIIDASAKAYVQALNKIAAQIQ